MTLVFCASFLWRGFKKSFFCCWSALYHTIFFCFTEIAFTLHWIYIVYIPLYLVHTYLTQLHCIALYYGMLYFLLFH
ncbi:hypothetical protein BZA77DRAFT_11506 [Pyronema omphalodes]|nr:hypothetical protein BZA77DRAFT_11506 [Pyronema omphalodes]